MGMIITELTWIVKGLIKASVLSPTFRKTLISKKKNDLVNHLFYS